MKNFLLILSLFTLFSCANEEAAEQTVTSDSIATEPTTLVDTTTVVEAPVETASELRKYGQQLLDDKVKPADNKLTKTCLDSLLSADINSRNFFFEVYLVIAENTTGVIGETASEQALAYFEKFPREALDHYIQLDKDEKAIFEDDLAFEFYASGGDIAFDVNDCIDGVKKRCKSCLNDDKILEDIRLILIKKANKMKTSG